MARPDGQGGIDYVDGGFLVGAGIYPLVDDLGELAARLWSPYVRNREGNVLFMECWQHGLGGWALSGTGADEQHNIVTENAQSFGYCLKMIPTEDESTIVDAQRRFPPPELGRWGIEFMFHVRSDGTYFYCFLNWCDGAQKHSYVYRYDVVNSKSEILDSDGSYVTIDTAMNASALTDMLNYVKLVVDVDGGAYDRLICNDNEYDISAYAPQVTAYTYKPHIALTFRNDVEARVLAYVYLDNIIFTFNEPDR